MRSTTPQPASDGLILDKYWVETTYNQPRRSLHIHPTNEGHYEVTRHSAFSAMVEGAISTYVG